MFNIDKLFITDWPDVLKIFTICYGVFSLVSAFSQKNKTYKMGLGVFMCLCLHVCVCVRACLCVCLRAGARVSVRARARARACMCEVLVSS